VSKRKVTIDYEQRELESHFIERRKNVEFDDSHYFLLKHIVPPLFYRSLLEPEQEFHTRINCLPIGTLIHHSFFARLLVILLPLELPGVGCFTLCLAQPLLDMGTSTDKPRFGPN
jgi:hypothetical protein